MREVNHRSKNMLALVHSIARQTAASDSRSFLSEFEQRILALSASHDLLISSGWRGVAMGALIESQLAHFKGLLGTRISARGPAITLAPVAAQTLGMALHELATNAGKYGALANMKGRVAIEWEITPSGSGERRFVMSWSETGGPRVTPPNRVGFGTTVIERMCRMSLDADVTLDYAKTGFIWKLECPFLKIVEGIESSLAPSDRAKISSNAGPNG
jgi:two-component sensor histidine kinase